MSSNASSPVRRGKWKLQVVQALAELSRPLMRNLPEETRERLHQGFLRRHVAWRDITVDFTTRDGFRINGPMRETLIRRLYFDDVWEPGVVRLIRRKLRRGDVFIDAGSNFGYMSLIASRVVGPEGRVHAIDASPSIHARLQRVMAENGCDNVVCVNAAVSDEERELKVFLASPINPGNTTVVDDPQELARRGATFESMVAARPLAALVPPADLARTALIKIDVEGHEREVLAGILPSLDAMRADVALMVEFNRYVLNKAGHDANSVLAPFRARGFRTFDLPDASGVCAPMPVVDDHYNPWGVVDVLIARSPP